MNVLYDSAAFLEPMGGVSRYYTEIIKRMPSDVQCKIAASSSDNAYLQLPPFSLPKPCRSFRSFWPGHHFHGKLPLYKALTTAFPRCMPSMERQNARLFSKLLPSCDLVHITAPHRYDATWRKCVGKKPTVITIVDLIPDILWNDPRIIRERRKVVNAVDRIIVISEHTKRDLVRLYDVSEDKIRKIYLGYTAPDSHAAPPLFDFEKYILFVGKRSGYKNFNFFFSSIVPLLKDDPSLRLVCTGLPFSEAERTMISQAGVTDRVVQRFVSDDEMASLYTHASCFVFPSKYEGFGLPTLDAFHYHCPVVLSHCSCFPEVAGEAAFYFEDGDVEGLRRAVMRSISDGPEREVMIQRGIERCKLFDWNRTAEETASVYRELLRG